MNISSYKPNFCFLAVFLSGFIFSTTAFGQEINADVIVDRSQISSTSLNYLDNFPEQLETYINEYDWIDPTFRDEERIGMDIQITLLSVDDNFNFDAQIVIRSLRPIYNTTQETVLFLFNDEDWNFSYTPNRTLVHDELQFDPLTSLIDYYAHIVLGFDFDSFEELGGTPYYQDAQNILSRAQTSTSGGWSRGNRRNRSQLIADLISTNYALYRRAVYQYHRRGLDAFLNTPEQARQQVLEALQTIQEAQRNTSNNLLFDIFFNAKYREIVSIFEDAEPEVRLEAYNLLSNIDQGHLSEYQKLQ